MPTDPKNEPIFEATPSPAPSVTTEPEVYPEPVYVPPPRKSLKERQDDEAKELRLDFTQQLLALRNPPPAKEYVPPAPPPQIIEQTRLEMEAGAKRVAANEKAQEANRAARAAMEAKVAQANKAKGIVDGTTISVFRPEDYAPNMNQGHIQATTLKG